jgi:hypothetical protein
MFGKIPVKGGIVGHFDIEWHCKIAAHLQQHQRIGTFTHGDNHAIFMFVPQNKTMRFCKRIGQIKQRRVRCRWDGFDFICQR